MIKPFTVPFLLLIILLGCNNSKPVQTNIPSIKSAVWYNWSGGQPGVGGTNYEIMVETQGGLLEVSSLMIDKQSLSASIEDKGDNLYVITTSENRSVLDESIPRMDRRPDFRTTSPETCQLTLLIDNVPVTLNISDFEKGQSKNYP
ncbi:MAG: hypothetical protein RIC35_07915 [Marinoscillum sp.]